MTNKWTNELLDSMREVTDPLADEVVAAVIQSGGPEAFDQMIRHLVNNRDEIPASLPQPVHDYFEQTGILPAWADPEKILRGEQVFDLYGPEMITMLFFVALPCCLRHKEGLACAGNHARIDEACPSQNLSDSAIHHGCNAGWRFGSQRQGNSERAEGALTACLHSLLHCK